MHLIIDDTLKQLKTEIDKILDNCLRDKDLF